MSGDRSKNTNIILISANVRISLTDNLENDPDEENMYIHAVLWGIKQRKIPKNKWFRKLLSEIWIIIYEELYGKDWHMTTANELWEQLENFKVSISNSEDEQELVKSSQRISSILLSSEDSLRKSRKDKGLVMNKKFICISRWRKTSDRWPKLRLEII